MAYYNGSDLPGNINATGLVAIDQHYNPESENPQSGKAVAQALAGFSGSGESGSSGGNTNINTEKSISGEIISVNDVSSTEHTLGIKITGVDDPTTVTLKRCGKNLFDINNTSGFESLYTGISNEINENSITVSCSVASRGGFLKLGTFPKGTYYISFDTSISLTSVKLFTGDTLSDTINTQNTLPEAYTSEETTTLWIYCAFSSTDSPVTFSNIQVELGDEKTEYEDPNISTHTPNTDGTVSDVKSLSPNMTLFTDVDGAIIELKYNVDFDIQDVLDKKQDVLVSGENIKTINGQSILDGGNIEIGGSGGEITIDQTYNPKSENAQSGVAVAEVISQFGISLQCGNINNTSNELGNIGATGESENASITRCDDYISVIGGNTIYTIFEDTGIKYMSLKMYDKDKTYLSAVNLYAKNMYNGTTYPREVTLPEDCAYVRFTMGTSGAIDYKVGLYYSYYNTTVVEDYVAPTVYIDSKKIVGSTVEGLTDRLTADNQSELLRPDNYIVPEYEYSIRAVEHLKNEMAYLWDCIGKMQAPTVLDSGVCGESLTWTLYSDGLLKISGTGRSYDYCKGILIGKTREEIEAYCESSGHTEYGFQEGKIYDDENGQYVSPWYKYRDEVGFGSYCNKEEYDAHNPNGWKYNRIEIDEGITYLGDWLFYRVSGPAELIVPSTVTELGDWAIRYSPTLKCIYLPDDITTVGYRGCSRNEVATAIRIGEGLTSVGDYAFSSNHKVKYLEINGAITTQNEYMFNGNTELEYVSFKNVLEIPKYACVMCSKLSKVDIPDTVTAIKYGAFVNISTLTSVRIPQLVDTIETNAFYQCTSLKTVYIDSPTIAGSLTYYHDFGQLISNAKYIYIKNDITTLGTYIIEKCTKVGDINGYVLYIVNT